MSKKILDMKVYVIQKIYAGFNKELPFQYQEKFSY